MQCEVCGRSIKGKTFKAIIEGARLVVCPDCALLGSMSWELKPSEQRKPRARVHRPIKQKSRFVMKRQSPLEPTLELVADFGTRIRQAREANGFSHEDLGRRINEKISVIRKLESHKMKPDNKLAGKLQHALKIKLLVPPTRKKLPKELLATTPKTVTLGDLIGHRERSSEETK